MTGLITPAGVFFPVPSSRGKHVSEQYLSDLYWAAMFGVPCPICQGVMTFVRVDPPPLTEAHWNSTLSNAGHAVRPDPEPLIPARPASSAADNAPTYFG